jgi:sRNA-binding protein
MTAPRRPIITLKGKKPVAAEPDQPPAPISKTALAKARLKAATAWMQETWPLAFRSPIRPLAVGCGAEILAHPSGDFTADERHAALRAWTGRSAYQSAIIERRMRVKLDGADASPVTDDERRHAFERVKARP